MWSASWADVLIGIAALLLTLRVLVPPVMVSLGRIRLRVATDDDPSTAMPADDDPSYAGRFSEFEALGFRPVGSHVESASFVSIWDWRKAFVERWMAAPDDRTLVSLHRLVPDEPVRFGAATLLSEGALVRTSCPGVGPPMQTVGKYRRVSLPGVAPAELVERHQEHVAAFCREGGLTVRPARFSEAADLEAALGQDLLNQMDHGAILIFAIFAVVGGIALGLLRLFGGNLDPRDAAYAAGIASGAVLWIRRFVVMPQFRRDARASHFAKEGETIPTPRPEDVERLEKSAAGRFLLVVAMVVGFAVAWGLLKR